MSLGCCDSGAPGKGFNAEDAGVSRGSRFGALGVMESLRGWRRGVARGAMGNPGFVIPACDDGLS